MRNGMILLATAVAFAALVAGCAAAPGKKRGPDAPVTGQVGPVEPTPVRGLSVEVRKRDARPGPGRGSPAAAFPAVESFGAMDTPLGHALQMLLSPFGYSLEADETVNLARKVWVPPFRNLPLDRAVRRVLTGTGYAWRMDPDGRTVRVSGLETRTWRLPFLNLVENAKVLLDAGSGGTSTQVSGSLVTSSASGQAAVTTPDLSGSRGLSLRTESVVDDPWKDVEKSVRSLLSPKGRYLIDRLTGALTVTDTPRVVATVGAYVRQVTRIASRQVELEVTITEVTLSDEYQAGVDWSKLAGVLGGGWRLGFRTWGAPFSLTDPQPGTGGGKLLVGNGSVQAVVAALAGFGKVKVVANPRLRVLNNSTAQIFVGESVPYLARYEKSATSETFQVSVETSEARTGLALSVTPAVDDRGVVRISVAPVLSDLMGVVTFSPAEDVQVSRPRIKTREMRTVLLLRPGETAVMGGLIMERTAESSDGIPWLKDVPVAGALFRMEKRSSRKVELVIGIRPKVLFGPGVGA